MSIPKDRVASENTQLNVSKTSSPPLTLSAKITAQYKPALAVPKPVYKPAVITGPLSPAAIKALGACESGNNPTTNTGNGFYGAFQFTISTWNAMQTGYARADLAPYTVQVAAVQKLLTNSSIYTQFPACALKLKAQGLI